MEMTDFQPGRNAVTFPSEGETLEGHLFLPPAWAPGQRLPAVVVAPTWTSVKEQMADRYASRLAAQGFAALAFDFRFNGASGGRPRNYESPEQKIRDIGSAVSFLTGLPMVEADQLGGLGICAGAGYMARAVAADPRLRAYVAVAPWLHDAELVRLIYGGEAGVAARIAAGEAARREYETTGQVAYVPACSASDTTAAMYGPFDYYLDPARGAIPEWPNQFAVMSWPEWLQFDPIRAAPQIRVPTLLIHSEAAAIPDGARRFFAALAAPKEFLWTAGTQFDFYDQEPQVSKATEAAGAHFRHTLSSR